MVLGGFSDLSKFCPNVTSHGKTHTNAFPLNGLKRWQSVGKALAKCSKSVGYPLGTRCSLSNRI